jgi:hypothetical protein
MSVGMIVIEGVAITVSLAIGEIDASSAAVGVVVSVGCTKLIDWQEDNSVNRKTEMTNFLSTFGVYHKIYSSNLD